jgi:hypothetical protein
MREADCVKASNLNRKELPAQSGQPARNFQ